MSDRMAGNTGGENMPDTISKTDNFLKAIEKYAEEQRTKMQSEAEVYKARELNRAEEEGLKEAYVLIQRKMSEIHNKISSELSKAESASKKKIFLRRQEIEEEVFMKAEKKLTEYTKTEEYRKALMKSAATVGEKLTANDVVLCVREADMNLCEQIQKAFGRPCEVQPSEEIRLGGLIGLSRSMGRIADETLDTRLSEEHEWFCRHSGLRVTN